MPARCPHARDPQPTQPNQTQPNPTPSVHFIGEEGVDGGGLRKEFLQLLVARLSAPEYGLFCELPGVRLQWLCDASLEAEAEWLLVGCVLGLAIYNGVLLDLRLPAAFWRKLLGQPARRPPQPAQPGRESRGARPSLSPASTPPHSAGGVGAPGRDGARRGAEPARSARVRRP